MTAASARVLAAQAWLAERLAHGPVESRSLLAAADASGITRKTLRMARETLHLEVKRSGFGPAIRSTWALPTSDLQARHECESGCPHTDVPSDSTITFTEGETRRTMRRVAYFQTKGMLEPDALRLARHLVLNRDRTGASLTSCAECQNFTSPSQCRARIEGWGDGPRDVNEIWYCFVARVEIS